MHSNNDIPYVTILTPSYESKYLIETINSVLMQDYKKIQYIIIDDGSKNFSPQLIRDHIAKNKKNNIIDFVLIDKIVNSGTVNTLNTGLEHARGNYIFIVAADDILFDSKVISDWVKEFQETNATVITAYRDIYDESMQNLITTLPTDIQAEKIRTLSSHELFEDIASGNYISGSCTAFSAYIFKNFGKFDEKYRLIEDFPTILKLLRHRIKCLFFQRKVIKYRFGGVSSQKRNTHYKKDLLNILNNEVFPYSVYTKYIRWIPSKYLKSYIYKLIIKMKRIWVQSGA